MDRDNNFYNLLTREYKIQAPKIIRDDMGGYSLVYETKATVQGGQSARGRMIEDYSTQKDIADIRSKLFFEEDVEIQRLDRIIGDGKIYEVIDVREPFNSTLPHHLEVVVEEIQPEPAVALMALIEEESLVSGILRLQRIILQAQISELTNITGIIKIVRELAAELLESGDIAGNLTKITLLGPATLSENISISSSLNVDKTLISSFENISDITASLKGISFFISDIYESSSMELKTLKRIRRIPAEILEASNVSGSLYLNVPLVTAFTEGSQIAGILRSAVPLISSFTENTEIISLLRSIVPLNMNIGEQSNISGFLKSLIPLYLNVEEFSQIEGDLTVILAAIILESEILETSGIEGTLFLTVPLISNAAEDSNITAGLKSSVPLIITVVENTDVRVLLRRMLLFTTEVINTSDITASLPIIHRLRTSLIENSLLTASLKSQVKLLASLVENDNITGLLRLTIKIISSLTENSNITAVLKSNIPLIGTVNEGADITVLLRRTIPFIAEVVNSSNITADLPVAHRLRSTSIEESFLTASLKSQVRLAAGLIENESITALLRSTIKIGSSLSENSEITAILPVTNKFISSFTEDSNITADLPVATRLRTSFTEDSTVSGILISSSKLISSFTEDSVIDGALTVTPPTFFTDFSDYTIGQIPDDWSERLETVYNSTTYGNWSVESKSNGITGGVTLENTNTDDKFCMLSWDVADGEDDVEIVAKVRTSLAGSTQMRLIARASGTQRSFDYGNRDIDAYFLDFFESGGSTEIRCGYYLHTNGVDYTLFTDGDISYSWSADTWYWFRLRLNGSDYKARWWADGESEPGTWNFETTTTEITSGNWNGVAGFYNTGSSVRDFDVVGIGLGGATAPKS